MRNTLAFLGALVLAVAGLGWYLGWYQVFFAPARDGHETVKIDINTDKVTSDLQKGEQKVLQEGKQLHDALDTGKAGHPAKRDGDRSTSSLLQPPVSIMEEQEARPSGKPDSPPPLPTPFGRQ